MSKFLNQKFLTKRLLVDYVSLLVMDIDGGYARAERILFLVPSVGRSPSLLGQISRNLRGARIAVGLLMSNVTVIVRKDCHISFNS